MKEGDGVSGRCAVEVLVDLERDDVEALRKQVAWPRPPLLAWVTALCTAVLAGVLANLLVLPVVLGVKLGTETPPLFLVGAGLGLGVSAYLAGWLEAGARASANGVFRAALARLQGRQVKVALHPEGVSLEGEQFSAFYAWPYFPDLIQTGNHLFLFTERYEAVVVPRRCFDSDREFIAFCERCRRSFDRPQTGAAPAPLAPSTGIQANQDEFTHASRD